MNQPEPVSSYHHELEHLCWELYLKAAVTVMEFSSVTMHRHNIYCILAKIKKEVYFNCNNCERVIITVIICTQNKKQKM